MSTSQILAVWGSPGAGKTTVSVKLARQLSRKNKSVIVVLCDNTCPAMPVILPSVGGGGSLGEVLAGAELTQDRILTGCVTLEKQKNIAILGYGKGENAFTYAQYTRERAVDFLVLLRHLADCVIIDCGGVISSARVMSYDLIGMDLLSPVALEMSDRVVRLIGCDLKGLSYFSSQLPLLMDRSFNIDRHIKVLSNVRPWEPSEEVREGCMGGADDLEIPYTPEIMEQYLTGTLITDDMKSKEGKIFEQSIKDIAKEVFNE